MATKMATMSKGPRTLGRIPGAIRSESSSPGLAGAPTVEVVVAISPPWVAVLPYCLPCNDDCVKARITGSADLRARGAGFLRLTRRTRRAADRTSGSAGGYLRALGAKGYAMDGAV